MLRGQCVTILTCRAQFSVLPLAPGGGRRRVQQQDRGRVRGQETLQGIMVLICHPCTLHLHCSARLVSHLFGGEDRDDGSYPPRSRPRSHCILQQRADTLHSLHSLHSLLGPAAADIEKLGPVQRTVVSQQQGQHSPSRRATHKPLSGL